MSEPTYKEPHGMDNEIDPANGQTRLPPGGPFPTANKVTPEQIQALKDRVIYHTAPRIGTTTSTFVHAYLDGKFYLATGHSACVDPANFDVHKGYDIAQRNAEYAVNQKLWELEGYALWKNLQ